MLKHFSIHSSIYSSIHQSNKLSEHFAYLHRLMNKIDLQDLSVQAQCTNTQVKYYL